MSNKLLRFTTLVLALALMSGPPLLGAQSNGDAEVRLREAMHAEVSDGEVGAGVPGADGELEEAITIGVTVHSASMNLGDP